MRRRWIPVAALVACAGLATQTGIAYAGGSGQRPAANSCANLVKGYKNFSKDTGSSDVTNPASLSAAFKRAAADVKALAKNAPSQIKGALNDLANAYKQLSGVDFSNQANLAQLTVLAQPPLPSDLLKLANYFSRQCNFSIPTT
jgi:hypothetical protein